MNAEELLAELKQALESSTPAAHAPPRSLSTPPKPSSPPRETRRSHWGVDLPAEANVDGSIRRPTDLRKSVTPSSRRWTLTAGGLAVGGAAAFVAGAALMSQVLNRPAHEFSAAATVGLDRPQNEQMLKPSGESRAPIEASGQAAPLQAGALETRSTPSPTVATGGSAPAPGTPEAGAPHLGSFGLETTAPTFTSGLLNQPAALAPAIRIGPDGAPIATAPSAPASTGSAHPAEQPKPAVPSAAPQMVKSGLAPTATMPTPAASTDSAHPAQPPKPAAPQMVKSDATAIATAPPPPASTDSAHPAQPPKSAAPQMVKSDATAIATAPPPPASTDSAHPAQPPNRAPARVASQAAKPDGTPIATASPTPISTNSAPLTETPKPATTPIAHASNESKQPSTPKIDSKRKPIEKASLQKPVGRPTPPIKPTAQAERQSTEPAPQKEAERSPLPAQGAGNPAPVAPVAAPSVPQRVADGVTHAFGYLVHLPGALVPRLGGSNPNTQ